jgi:hypothetical protein|tara:strand:- start:118 stop:339 length:222 start_codon:yes stop_codon:yes gene_type:complete
VANNGVCRKKMQEIRRTHPKYQKSQGMSSTEGRLQIINKVNYSDLSVTIEDIDPDNFEEAGIRVMIYLPLNQE